MKPTKKIEPTCKYCWHFFNNPIITKEPPFERRCKTGNLTIHKDSPRCDKFILCANFHCETHKHFVAPDACCNRQIEKFEGCIRCKIGPVIKELRKEKFFLQRKNGEAPALIRRKKSEPFTPKEQRPVLIRRLV